VVVLSAGPFLIVVMVFVKVYFFDQTPLLEHLQVTVDSRQAESGVLSTGLPVDIISIKVPVTVTNNIQD